jgi:hypothetical protein
LAHPQLGQIGQRRRRPAPSIEQPIDLLHQATQAAQLRLTASDPPQGLPLRGRQVPLDEQVAVLEQIADFLLDPFLAAGVTLGGLRGRTTPRQLGHAGRQVLAQLGHGGENSLGHFLEDVECAELMRHLAEDCGDRPGIER